MIVYPYCLPGSTTFARVLRRDREPPLVHDSERQISVQDTSRQVTDKTDGTRGTSSASGSSDSRFAASLTELTEPHWTKPSYVRAPGAAQTAGAQEMSRTEVAGALTGLTQPCPGTFLLLEEPSPWWVTELTRPRPFQPVCFRGCARRYASFLLQARLRSNLHVSGPLSPIQPFRGRPGLPSVLSARAAAAHFVSDAVRARALSCVKAAGVNRGLSKFIPGEHIRGQS
jgi:hypothetical protein